MINNNNCGYIEPQLPVKVRKRIKVEPKALAYPLNIPQNDQKLEKPQGNLSNMYNFHLEVGKIFIRIYSKLQLLWVY